MFSLYIVSDHEIVPAYKVYNIGSDKCILTLKSVGLAEARWVMPNTWDNRQLMED